MGMLKRLLKRVLRFLGHETLGEFVSQWLLQRPVRTILAGGGAVSVIVGYYSTLPWESRMIAVLSAAVFMMAIIRFVQTAYARPKEKHASASQPTTAISEAEQFEKDLLKHLPPGPSQEQKIAELKNDNVALEKQLEGCKQERERDILERDRRIRGYKRDINRLEFLYVETPKVVEALGRTPTVAIQYYTGQDSRDLASRVMHFFLEMNWSVAEPKEVPATNISNPNVGKRIMVNYGQIGAFHEAMQKLEFSSAEQSGFFDPEMIVVSAPKTWTADSDIIVTIFPKTYWS